MHFSYSSLKLKSYFSLCIGKKNPNGSSFRGRFLWWIKHGTSSCLCQTVTCEIIVRNPFIYKSWSKICCLVILAYAWKSYFRSKSSFSPSTKTYSIFERFLGLMPAYKGRCNTTLGHVSAIQPTAEFLPAICRRNIIQTWIKYSLFMHSRGRSQSCFPASCYNDLMPSMCYAYD